MVVAVLTRFAVVGSSLAGRVAASPQLPLLCDGCHREGAEWDVKCFDGKFCSF